MSADIFQSAGPVDESGIEESPFSFRGDNGKEPSETSGGIFREDTKAGKLKGRAPAKYDPRKFKYDAVRGRAANLAFDVSKEDRMSPVEGGRMLHRIHQLMGIDRESEGILRAFDRAVFFCHTVNGASVVGPGRAVFSVPGHTEEFRWADVKKVLNVDERRFFRCYADDVTEVNREIIDEYDPYDPPKAERYGQLMQVAYARGLHRFPWLAHDSADACMIVNASERAALAASKTLVISTSNNSADRMVANNRVTSADGWDSTVGEAV